MSILTSIIFDINGAFIEDSTLSVSSVVGLSPHYHAGSPAFTVDDFNHMWQAEAETIYQKTGIYVSVVTTDASVIYREDSGCPTGGEKAVDVSADCNPYYSFSLGNISEQDYTQSWQDAFLEILENVAKKLDQSTVTVKFSDDRLIYLTTD